MKDKYDEAIDWLLAQSDFKAAVYEAWEFPLDRKAGALFLCCTPLGFLQKRKNAVNYCGCLTQVRKGQLVAWTDKLTEQIRADDRLPDDPFAIEPKHLPVFAEWQRRLDVKLGRK